MKKHILFIFFDQLRYDGIGANGNPYVITPAIERLPQSHSALSVA